MGEALSSELDQQSGKTDPVAVLQVISLTIGIRGSIGNEGKFPTRTPPPATISFRILSLTPYLPLLPRLFA